MIRKLKPKEPEPTIDETEDSGYISKCGTYAAVPFTKGQFIIIHNGEQIRTCRSLSTAKTFIQKELKKVK